jgi:phosphatidylglycerol:prolipoprotein diacylglycerol transferase
MLLLALGTGWWLARGRAERVGVGRWHIDWLAPLLLAACLLGAWALGQVNQRLSGSFANGRVLFGGLLLAVIVAAVYAGVARIPLGRLGDAFAYSLPLGIALLRVGCFLAGCCWGDLCTAPDRLAMVDDPAWRRQVQTVPALCRGDWPIHVRFPAGSPAHHQHVAAGLVPPTADRSLPVHPVQLYESLAVLGLLVLLVLADRRLRCWGDSFLLFGMGYSAIRFAIEWFRADNRSLMLGLTFWQVVSVLCLAVCGLLWFTRRRLARRQRLASRWCGVEEALEALTKAGQAPSSGPRSLALGKKTGASPGFVSRSSVDSFLLWESSP